MRGKLKIILVIALLVALVLAVVSIVTHGHMPVLQPAGAIADKQRDLIILATALMLLVIVPVYILTFAIAWRYRASNTKAKYSPNLSGNRWLETIWWGIPMVIISILAVITWQTSHELDPFRPLVSSTKPIRIQVVALQWKWLFIYPDQKIATVNDVRFPAKTPINFELTSDAPMNSFWIPSLGSQIYTMAGMSTQVHLIANSTGVYRGSSANISGEGFAGMRFKAVSQSNKDFTAWVKHIKRNGKKLDTATYDKLAQPSANTPTSYYGEVDKNIYNRVVLKYLVPPGESLQDIEFNTLHHHEE